jgi:hypothetical protein
MKKLFCGLSIGLIIAILASCQISKIDLVTAPSVTLVFETKTVVAPTPIATETFIPMACLSPGYPGTIHYANEDKYGDGYIARMPIKDVTGLNYDEIVKILVTQWLEHYKTQSSVASAAIKDYAVEKISLLDSSCDPFFKFVAGVKFSVIPSQVPHDMGSFPGEGYKEGDPWWHIGAPFGVFVDGENYRLRLVFGFGT